MKHYINARQCEQTKKNSAVKLTTKHYQKVEFVMCMIFFYLNDACN